MSNRNPSKLANAHFQMPQICQEVNETDFVGPIYKFTMTIIYL